jgi:hypothetical protein
MAREFLHVAQAPPDLGDLARGAGHEGATPGMRRTAVHLQRGREPMEPINGQIVLQRGYWDKRTFLRLQGLPVPREP